MRDKKDRYNETVTTETKEEVKVTKSFTPYKVEATIPKLRVREAPNSEAEEIDTISLGQSVTIVDEVRGWGKTKFGNGWVNLKYARRV